MEGYEGGICLKARYEQHCNILRVWRGQSEDADVMEKLMVRPQDISQMCLQHQTSGLQILLDVGEGGIKPFCPPGNRPKREAADRYSIFAVSAPKSSR